MILLNFLDIHFCYFDSNQIYNLFEGINVVSFRVEPELTGEAEDLQIRKLLNLYDSGNYDDLISLAFEIRKNASNVASFGLRKNYFNVIYLNNPICNRCHNIYPIC